MRTPLFELQDVRSAFARRKVLTKEELLRQTGCSAMTAWRLLRQHGYLTSYNDNARHYTLVGIPAFDQHGLWNYRRARFSKWGSLTETIVGLVQESPSGLTADQLQQRLQIPNVKPILTRLTAEQRLTRERVAGRFVYFAVESASGGKQRRQRAAQTQQAKGAVPLSPLEHIVALLVEIIRRPKHTPRQWSRRLAGAGIRLGTGEIATVLDHYQIV